MLQTKPYVLTLSHINCSYKFSRFSELKKKRQVISELIGLPRKTSWNESTPLKITNSCMTVVICLKYSLWIFLMQQKYEIREDTNQFDVWGNEFDQFYWGRRQQDIKVALLKLKYLHFSLWLNEFDLIVITRQSSSFNWMTEKDFVSITYLTVFVRITTMRKQAWKDIFPNVA